MEVIKLLSDLEVGESSTVVSLTLSGAIRRRMSDIGLTPGVRVVCIGKAPFGDPRAFLIRGKTVAIRGRDADGIEVVTA